MSASILSPSALSVDLQVQRIVCHFVDSFQMAKLMALVYLVIAISANQCCALQEAAEGFATTEDRTMSLSPIPNPVKGSIENPDWQLTVDDTSSGRKQKITGFGASWTDATVNVFDALSETDQGQVMRDLFLPEGINLGLMRHSIGQSDMTPSGQYSYDENGGQPDTSLAHFNLTDPGWRMVDWITRMQKLKSDVTLFGTVWSPPGWMKNDNTINWPYVDSWVAYLVKYLQEFQKAGVKVDALTIQNEPLHNGDSAWTTYLDSSYAVILTNKLGAAIESAGLGTEIWAYDHNVDSDGWNYVTDVVSQAGDYVGAVAWHCYATNYWEGPDQWSTLTDFSTQYPNIPQIMTECWNHLQDEDFFNLPDFIQGPIRNTASGAMAWTLGGSTNFDVGYPGLGSCGQCSGLVQVDKNSGDHTLTQDFYNLGQFSKFVQKSATYLDNSGGWTYADGTGVTFSSFLNPDGSRVLVVLNKIYNDLHTQVTFKSGDVWNGWLKKRSVTTWVISSSSQIDSFSSQNISHMVAV